jgi:hypothetical protein
LFQTYSPTQSSLSNIDLTADPSQPLARRTVRLRQLEPGDAMCRELSSAAIERGDRPSLYRAKIQRTVAACSSSISRRVPIASASP